MALLDVGEHQISTFVGEELAALPAHLADYDLLGAMDVRGLMCGLDIDPGERCGARIWPTAT